MHVELTPEMEAIVTGQVSTGHYASAQAVVEEALMEWKTKSVERGKSCVTTDELLKLFAEFDAAGGADFVLERDTRRAEEREFF